VPLNVATTRLAVDEKTPPMVADEAAQVMLLYAASSKDRWDHRVEQAGSDIIFGSLTDRIGTAVRPDGGWWVSNAGWVIGDHTTLAIDTFASESRVGELLTALHAAQRQADRPNSALQLVLTHAHGDHANGAGMFEAAGATVFASAEAADELLSLGIQTFPTLIAPPSWGAVAPPSAVIPLIGTTVFDLGGVEAEVTVLPSAAHTAGDVLVRLPAEGVLFAGDMVWGQVTPLAAVGSVTGWLAQMDTIARWPLTTVVPGHGNIGGAELIDSTRRYLDWILTLAAEVLAGRPLDPAAIRARRATQEWRNWGCPERDVVNIPRAVADLSGDSFSLPAGLAALKDEYGGLLVLEP